MRCCTSTSMGCSPRWPPTSAWIPPRALSRACITHDRTGIIHMEASHPYRFTLGDFFAVWGVKLGPGQLGGLTGYGGDRLHFYRNGRPLSNPAAHVLHNNDSIAIGYGADSSFPHAPSTLLLTEVEGKGGTALACSSASKGHRSKSCLVSKPASSATSWRSSCSPGQPRRIRRPTAAISSAVRSSRSSSSASRTQVLACP